MEVNLSGVAYTHNEIICMELNHEVRIPYFLLFKYCGFIKNLMLHFYIHFSILVWIRHK